MTCPNCGRVNPPEARFCGRCGAELAVPPPTPTESAPQTPAPAPKPAQRGRPETGAGVWQRVVLGLAALGLLLGALSSIWSYPVLGIPPLVVGLGFGIAAARPPRGRIFRRVLVSVACLGLLLAAAAGVFFIVVIIWLFSEL